VLGKIIESVTDTSLDKSLKELVWTPLGMNSTTYHPDKSRCVATEFGNQIEMKMVQDLSLSFSSFRPTDQPIVGESDDGNCYYYFNGVAGHAGIFSTAEDVARLGKAYLYPDHHYLSPELVKQAMTVQVENRGLGFQFGDNYPSGGCGHTGFTGTYLYLQKEKDLLITILTNRLHVKEVQQIQTFRNDVVNTILS
jgi:CubicO group peptidase (beta-lactamase class C family)